MLKIPIFDQTNSFARMSFLLIIPTPPFCAEARNFVRANIWEDTTFCGRTCPPLSVFVTHMEYLPLPSPGDVIFE